MSMNYIIANLKDSMIASRCDAAAKLLLALFFLMSGVMAFASENPEKIYNLGVEEYQKGEFENASKSFAKALEVAKDSDLKFKSYYNLGNAEYKNNAFDKAVEAYKNALKIKKDYMAEHNLKKAQEKLEQKQEEDQKQDNNEGEQNEQNEQNEKDEEGKDDKDGQQGEKGQQREQGENGQNGEQSQEDQNGENGQDGQDGEQGKDNKEGDENKDPGQNGENNKEGQEQRQDVEMAEPGTQKEADVSQKARAMKNIRANPYMIEKILKEMQQREADLQRRARNENTGQREEVDPFEMNAQELRDWMQNRGRPNPALSDEPDW